MGVISHLSAAEQAGYWENELAQAIDRGGRAGALGEGRVHKEEEVNPHPIALSLNWIAFSAGKALWEARNEQAECELEKRHWMHARQTELVADGMSATAAEKQVRGEDGYRAANLKVEEASRVRERLELIHQIAFQRAAILAGIAREVR